MDWPCQVLSNLDRASPHLNTYINKMKKLYGPTFLHLGRGSTEKHVFLSNVNKREGGGHANVDSFLYFYNIIIKCQNADKGQKGGPTMWIKIFFMF